MMGRSLGSALTGMHSFSCSIGDLGQTEVAFDRILPANPRIIRPARE